MRLWIVHRIGVYFFIKVDFSFTFCIPFGLEAKALGIGSGDNPCIKVRGVWEV